MMKDDEQAKFALRTIRLKRFFRLTRTICSSANRPRESAQI
jgi:hypothetical protein